MARLILVIWLGIAGPAAAQFLAIGSRSMGLNGQQAIVDDAAGSLFTNPALLLASPRASIWISHYRPYQLEQIGVYALAANYSPKPVSIAMGYAGINHPLYRDQSIFAGAASHIAARIGLGLKFSRRWIEIAGYHALQASTIDLGVRMTVSEAIDLGILVKNAIRSAGGVDLGGTEREVRTGARFLMAAFVTLFTEISQQEHGIADFRFGFEFTGWRRLHFLVGSGYNTPQALAAGFSLQFTGLQIDYAVQNHTELGQTHVFTLALKLQG